MFKFGLFLVVAFSGLSMAKFQPQPYGDESSKRIALPFRIKSTETDTKLYIKQCQVTINFRFQEEPVQSQLVYMSINGLLENIEYTPGKTITYDLTPGKYQFKIWGGPGYQEVVTDSIEFKAQTRSFAEVDMNTTSKEIMVFKPVLYFHSDRERDFDLNVVPNNEFTFTYPAIDKGWKGKIHTDGSLTLNNRNYPYLFWEAKQNYSFKPSTNGYHLKKDEYVMFLEKKCDELGFTDIERTDFITFWGMKMQNHDELFVQFIFDENCNQFAELNFAEKPDVVRRVYIMISPWSAYFSNYLKDLQFESMPKSSYSVLEWGGYEFQIEENSFTANVN